ncbi:MAG: hypothetical protein N3C62_02460 [Synergistetes bacterium]|nr:hypothetical protein [Synergistota bacterium]MCX8127595.1 hypothetical protein [Synergistota bacterium]MDW8191488.1 hypothetical protein [Synergistota bacterium]
MKLLLILCDKAYELDVIEFLEKIGIDTYEMIDGARFSSPHIKRLSTPVWPGREVMFLGFLKELNDHQKNSLKDLKINIEKKGLPGTLPIRIYIQDIEEI